MIYSFGVEFGNDLSQKQILPNKHGQQNTLSDQSSGKLV